MRKGQASIFLTLGIVVVIAAGIIIFLVQSPENVSFGLGKIQTIDEATLKIDEYVDSCINIVSEPLIETISKRGGTFTPGSGILLDGTELAVHCTEDPELGCINSMLLRQHIERELSLRIGENLPNCIDFSVFNKQGVKIKSAEYTVRTSIERDVVTITLNYPLDISIADSQTTMDEFIFSVEFPLGRLYGAAVDIVNSEVETAEFDKNSWMMERGFEIEVERQRPYPHLIYSLTKVDKELNKNFTFQFAIRGFESTGTDLTRWPTQSGGCCVNTDGLCYKNAQAAACPGEYIESPACVCEANTEPIFTGCCKSSLGCFASTAERCDGTFVDEDVACTSCPENNCKNIWLAADQGFTGPPKKHGESWCMYDSIIGYGFDYVGSRHYVHSCLNGEIIVEECRDFREELCVEDLGEGNLEKAKCRINRWQDCTKQQNPGSCGDKTTRDCEWMNLLLNRETQCIPSVPPGFRFWENNGAQICNFASEDPSEHLKKTWPKPWAYSTLIFCHRQGDCGNWRNFVGEITEFGYHNQYGEPEPWVYHWEGLQNDGHNVILHLPFDAKRVSNNGISQGAQGSFASCNIWQAPNRNDICETCTEPFKVCSEYRCKSLGRNCQFGMVNGEPTCSSSGDVITDKPQIQFDEAALTPGYTIATSDSAYYGAKKHEIKPEINPYQPITIGFTTSRPSRCKLSLRPPNVPKAAFSSNVLLAALPQGWINNGYHTEHKVELRFPDKTLNDITEFLIFMTCVDNLGNENADENFLHVKTKNPATYVPPKVLQVEPDPSKLSVTNSETGLRFYVNKPFRECRYSELNVGYDSMKDSFKCNTTVYQMNFHPGTPLGSYICNAKLTLEKSRYHVNCMDWFDKSGNDNFILQIPS